MSFQFLGHYLLRNGVVTQSQVDEAVAHQAEANRRLGDMAVERGLLSPQQVDEILSNQRDTDLSFGQLAVTLGFVSKRDMDSLLFRQQVHQVHLGEALLILGHLTPQQFCQHLDAFAAQEKARKEALDRLFSGHCAREALETLSAALERAFLRFARCPLKAQGALDGKTLADMPLHHSLSIPLDQDSVLHFTLHLGEDMLKVLDDEARRRGRAPKSSDDALREVLDILDIIGRYLCSSLGARSLPPPNCPMADVPPGEIGENACLRMLLACPLASVGLTVSIISRSKTQEATL